MKAVEKVFDSCTIFSHYNRYIIETVIEINLVRDCMNDLFIKVRSYG